MLIMKIKNPKKLLASVLVCLAAGFVGSFFTTPSIPTWYAGLAKPALAPPNWVFGPVWTTLFILMGISLYLVWGKGLEKKNVRMTVAIFGIQLVLNVLWSALFFGLHSPFYAFIEIVALWLAIAATIFAFNKISRNAALLLLPYIIWVSIAAFLNLSIWLLNV